MCIAIVTNAGKRLDDFTFRRCFNNNRDGFGMAYINDFTGEVVIDKGFMEVNYALRMYREKYEKYGEKNPMLVHFRLRTAGEIGAPNCHPFQVKGGAMIHNGTFWRDASMDGRSDSRIVAETLHDKLHYANLSGNKEAFDKAFGYSRVAFLFNNGKYIIFEGDKSGQWDNGIWYSNGGWKGKYDGQYGDGNNGTCGSGSCPLPLESDDDDWNNYTGAPVQMFGTKGGT